MPLRLKPVARSLSVRAEFLGLELEVWGFLIAWAIVMRLIGDHIRRVFLGFMPVSSLMTYVSAAVLALAVFLPQAAAGRLRSESKTESELKLSSLAARVPISEIRDGLIVRRDGSFCAGWECSGVATQFAD